jgi:hypothetical protein
MSSAAPRDDEPAARQGFLARLGLHRPELRAWAFYDWANSVFMTTGLLIFPVYFSDVACAGSPPAVATAWPPPSPCCWWPSLRPSWARSPTTGP